MILKKHYRINWIRKLPDLKEITGHAIYYKGEMIKFYLY